jgi:GNAT superfamily N-acetyltransferase
MNDLDFIIGLMKTETENLGFIPAPTIAQRYIPTGRFLIQRSGHEIGYLLHGKPTPGGFLTIAQAVIEVDHRLQGHGMDLTQRLIDRARDHNVRVIKLRCADNAVQFWQSVGFEITRRDSPDNRRKRAINTMMLDLWPRLF